MQLDFAVLCQAANGAGLLNILGAGVNTINVVQLPGSVMATVAMNFWLDYNEFRQPHHIEVRFIDADGHPMKGINLPRIDFPGNPNASQQNPHLYNNVQTVINLAGALVQQTGAYAIDIVFDDQPVKRIPFIVQQVGPQMPPGPQQSPMPRML